MLDEERRVDRVDLANDEIVAFVLRSGEDEWEQPAYDDIAAAEGPAGAAAAGAGADPASASSAKE